MSPNNMFQITSFFLNYWNDWSAEQGKALHERGLEPKIHIHELLVVFFSAGLPAFLRKYLPPIQWLKLLRWPYFKGLYQIAALSHPCSRWLLRAPRKSLIYICCLCFNILRGITSRLLVQEIKDGKFQPASSHLFFLPCQIDGSDCAAFTNHFDWVYPE